MSLNSACQRPVADSNRVLLAIAAAKTPPSCVLLPSPSAFVGPLNSSVQSPCFCFGRPPARPKVIAFCPTLQLNSPRVYTSTSVVVYRAASPACHPPSTAAPTPV